MILTKAIEGGGSIRRLLQQTGHRPEFAPLESEGAFPLPLLEAAVQPAECSSGYELLEGGVQQALGPRFPGIVHGEARVRRTKPTQVERPPAPSPKRFLFLSRGSGGHDSPLVLSGNLAHGRAP